MRFVLTGPIKPYVHRTSKGKWSKRAQAYHASQNALRTQFKNQMRLRGMEKIERGVPLRIGIQVTVPSSVGHKQDCTNIQKACEDAAQGTVFDNDCWVDDIHTTRTIGDEWEAVVDICAL